MAEHHGRRTRSSGARRSAPRPARLARWIVSGAVAIVALVFALLQNQDSSAPANRGPAATNAPAPVADPPRSVGSAPVPVPDEDAEPPDPPANAATTTAIEGPRIGARTIVKVLDGDSAVLDGDEQIRYLLIDTPEKDEPFSDEARAMNRRLVEGRPVELELDVEPRDHYGRVLAHVFSTDPMTGARVYVNGELVRAGLARFYPHAPNVRHVDELAALQEEARSRKAGVWSLPPPEKADHYVGSRNGGRFHRPDCKHAAEIAERNRVRYDTRDSALDDGKSPCRTCKP